MWSNLLYEYFENFCFILQSLTDFGGNADAYGIHMLQFPSLPELDLTQRLPAGNFVRNMPPLMFF